MVDLPEAELVRITETVVREAAARGRVVVVGRAAPAVLERQANTLHVKLVAPRAWRIEVAAARLGVPLEKAAAVLDDTDKMRARYSREYYRRDWNDPVHFHMVLNTAALGLDGATEAVVGRARVLGWGSGPDGRDRSDKLPPSDRPSVRPYPNEIPPLPYPGSLRSGFIRV